MMDIGKYIGIPFKSKGREKDGCDCYGLVRLILKEQRGLSLPLLSSYEDSLNEEEVQKVIDKNVPLLSGEELLEPEEGCVVVLAHRGVESHIGLMISPTMMLHTTKETGAVIERITSHRIKNKIRGYYSVDQSYSTNESI